MKSILVSMTFRSRRYSCQFDVTYLSNAIHQILFLLSIQRCLPSLRTPRSSSRTKDLCDDHEFVTNSDFESGGQSCSDVCYDGHDVKSDRTDQQAKTRAIEHAPIDLTSRRRTRDRRLVTRSFSPSSPLTFSCPPLPPWFYGLFPSEDTRPTSPPDFPELTFGRSNRAAESGRPTASVSWLDRQPASALSCSLSSDGFTDVRDEWRS